VSIIHGKYRVLDKLAQGGQSSVFIAHDQNRRQQCILKVYTDCGLDEKILSANFCWLHKLRHSCILRPLDLITEPPACMVFPFVRTGNLSDYLNRQRKSFSLQKLGPFLAQMANVIDYIHSGGLVHRDIKPENFLLDAKGRIYLADFDLVAQEASLWHRKMAAYLPFLRSARSSGTHHYMAPEHLQGCPPHRSMDIYALATSVYSMLSGNFPFGQNPADRFSIVHYAPISRLTKSQNGVFRRALHPDARFRTASALEFYRQLLFG
jgi:serine/threonine-protein kinase